MLLPPDKRSSRAIFCTLSILSVSDLARIEQQAPNPSWCEESFRSEFGNAHSKVYGARYGGELIAFCVAHVIEDEGHILNLVLINELRGRGLGGHFLNGVLLELKERGAKSIWLEARCSNLPALKLYQSRGFVEITRRANYYRDTGEDAIVLLHSSLRGDNALL